MNSTFTAVRPYLPAHRSWPAPVVSTIIRTKDRPELLRQALRSVAEQTYPYLEAVVVNDGGQDVAEIVRAFQGAIARVRYSRFPQNRGRSVAANAGLEQAAGSYLIFLDDDDWFLPEHIAKLVAVLETDPAAGVAYTAVECVEEDAAGECKRVHVFGEPFDPVLLLLRNYIPMHAALFRRELVAAGCRLDEALETYEDWDFWVQLSQRTPFRYVEGISAVYRIGGAGGFGVAGQEAHIRQAQRTFFEKWRRLWSGDELLGIIDYAKHEPGFRLLKEEVERRGRHIDAILADLEQARGSLAQTRNALESAIRSLRQVRSEAEDRQREWDREWNRERDRMLREHEQALVSLTDELNLASESAAFWSERFREIESSRSWRITRPLRGASTWATRLARTARSALGGSPPSADLADAPQHATGRTVAASSAPPPGVRALIGRGLRALYHALPLSTYGKWRLKSFFYGHLGLLLGGSASYRHWLGQQELPAASAAPPPEAPAVRPPEIVQIGEGGVRGLASTLSFDPVEAPCVSVVIPVFNKVEYTVCCLASIHRHPPQASFEAIVVDDDSSDDTREIVGAIANVRYVRNERNLGFLRTANRGASLARGRYILFLNNDTQVLSGWLDSLVEAFAHVPEAGLVGSKLIYPSGHLQEAGALLKKDGTVELVGLNDDPDTPEYNLLREVDHCSGASLLVERALFEALGGFDERYAPAYFEDCDLSLRVRARGRKIVYQPASVVVHHLSVTTNDSTGAKMRQIEANKRIYLERWQEELDRLDRVRLIAFYLPQYHPIPENDRWWGKGFTEWTNVTKARPNFKGHYQPHLPADLGFYDLRVPEVREEQAALARRYGIYGFCYYYYWFAGKRLLHRPLDEVVRSGQPDFPFCVCWANENWSRRWDGRDSEILIAQDYSNADDLAFIEALMPALRDRRYIRIDGRPLLLVYRIGLLPDPPKTAAIWREHCRAAGLGEIYLASVQSFGVMDDPRDFGFDAAVEFPPHELAIVAEPPPHMLNARFDGMFYDYPKTAENFMRRPPVPYTRFRTAMPSWDNTARRQDAATIFPNAEPEHYERWLRHLVGQTRRLRTGDERLVFVNAWNEWAEGNHLEPDKRYGHRYLDATRNALGDLAWVEPAPLPAHGVSPAPGSYPSDERALEEGTCRGSRV